MPVVLIGAGMVWLAASSKNPPSRTYGYDGDDGLYGADSNGSGSSFSSELASAKNSAAHTASSAKGKAKAGADRVGAKAHSAAAAAGDAAHRAQDTARHLRAEARAKGARLGYAARSNVERIQDGYRYLSREQPLVLGGLAVAAGAALGALLPPTETEDQWVGETSDDAKARLKEEGEHQAERAKSAATGAADTATKRLKEKADEGNAPRV